MLITFVSCSDRENEYEKDILFTDDVRLPDELYKRAEEVFFGLLLCYERQKVTQNPLSTSELRAKASRGVEAIAELPVSPEGFGYMLDILEQYGEAVVIELVSLNKGFTKSRELYLSLSAELGADYVGSAIYQLLSLHYQLRYEKNMAEYDKYGYNYLLLDATTMLENSRILSEEIGRESFSRFVINALAVGELFFGEGLKDNYDSFSDSELLLFINSLRFDFEITAVGYEFLVYNVIGYFGPVGDKIVATARKNGDSLRLAEEMDDLMLLICELQSVLVAEDMAYIREDNGSMAFSLAFSRLSDSGWQRFRKICEASQHTDEYDAIMINYYGAKYINHSTGITPVSFEELVSMAGGEEFYEGFLGYLGGICPAFTFGIK